MADVTATVRAVVAVVDKATAPLRAISSQFKAFGQGLGGASKTMRELGNAAPIYKLGGALRGVATSARSVFGSIMRIATPIAALIGAGGIGGIAVAINRFASQGEHLQNMALATGDTVGHLQELEHWADVGGVSTEALGKAMARTNKAAGEAAHGNKGAAATFHALGIAVKDNAGHVRTFGEIAPVLADHFARMTNATDRARLGAKLFGKGWAEVVPLLARGKAYLAEATEEARRHGLLTDADAAAGKRLGDAQRNLGEAIHGVAMAISKRLAPTLTPLIERLSKWIDTNREAFATETVARIDRMATAWGDFSDKVGGVGNALEIVAGIVATITFAPLIAALAQLATAIIGVAYAAGLLDLAMIPVALGLGLILGAAWLLIKAWPMLAEVGEGAWQVIGAAADVVFGAMDAALVWLDKTSREIFSNLATWLGDQWATLWASLKPTDPGLLAIWDSFATSATEAFAKVLAGITGLWARIQSILPTWLGGSVSMPDMPPALATGGVGGRQLATDTGAPMSVERPGRLYGLGAAAAPGTPGANGRVDVVITAPNQPPGTRLATKTTGRNLQSRADVGYSMPQLVPAGAP